MKNKISVNKDNDIVKLLQFFSKNRFDIVDNFQEYLRSISKEEEQIIHECMENPIDRTDVKYLKERKVLRKLRNNISINDTREYLIRFASKNRIHPKTISDYLKTNFYREEQLYEFILRDGIAKWFYAEYNYHDEESINQNLFVYGKEYQKLVHRDEEYDHTSTTIYLFGETVMGNNLMGEYVPSELYQEISHLKLKKSENNFVKYVFPEDCIEEIENHCVNLILKAYASYPKVIYCDK